MGEKVTMDDVRRALWDAYEAARKAPDFMGKMAEGSCELIYPNIWECESVDEFLEPKGIMVYSYSLGPSRQHYFLRSDEDRQDKYYSWHSRDMYAKAVEVINQWRQEWEDEA